jgi:hypothetical protein
MRLQAVVKDRLTQIKQIILRTPEHESVTLFEI